MEPGKRDTVRNPTARCRKSSRGACRRLPAAGDTLQTSFSAAAPGDEAEEELERLRRLLGCEDGT